VLSMYLKINQQILIALAWKDVSFRSIVAEIQDEEILISIPVTNQIGILPNETDIEVTFKSGDDLFKFKTQIVGKKLDNIPLYIIKKPNEKQITRIQRRENFRVNLNLKLLLDKNEFTTINVSAGGVLFSTSLNNDLQEGDVVSGTILVPNSQNNDIENISFQGEIKRIYLPENNEIKYIGMQFIEISDQDQTKIVQSCFEQQRQMRLKRKA
jgi:c-di-GMP-binding flagellar brake protein YcgR